MPSGAVERGASRDSAAPPAPRLRCCRGIGLLIDNATQWKDVLKSALEAALIVTMLDRLGLIGIDVWLEVRRRHQCVKISLQRCCDHAGTNRIVGAVFKSIQSCSHAALVQAVVVQF